MQWRGPAAMTDMSGFIEVSKDEFYAAMDLDVILHLSDHSPYTTDYVMRDGSTIHGRVVPFVPPGKHKASAVNRYYLPEDDHASQH